MSLHLVLLSGVRLWAPTRSLPERLPPDDDALPEVLIQVPLFNEGNLIRRLVAALTALDWPRAKLHIQILDDSTGASLAISQAVAQEFAAVGWHIELQHRTRRSGFKAGALAAGLTTSDAAFVAIFDADFLPPPDFLRRTVGALLADPGLAYVQARWLHSNRNQNLLTRAQARLLDGHFLVEQEARQRLGLPTPFNGTCGLWRHAAIDEAGGWHGDTLTEDLDLSLRARLAGWRSGYLADLGVPGLLPVSPRAWRMQQFRWTKGFIECLVKLAPSVWSSPRLATWQKLMITLQLVQPLAFLAGCLTITASIPYIAGMAAPGPVVTALALGMAVGGMAGPISLLLIGARTNSASQQFRQWAGASLWQGAAALLLTSGLILSNARANLEALIRHRSDFVRTPKPADAAGTAVRLRKRAGVFDLTAGGALLVFVLLQHPSAVLPLGLVIGGLLGFGLMQISEARAQSPAAAGAILDGD
ncbi:MAG: glycosyltransferase [Thiohalocapsa sp.]